MAQQVAPSTGLTPVPDHDFMPLNGIHHVELYVGNALQAAYFYAHAFGFQRVAYRGLETGTRDQVSHVLQQGRIRLVLTGALHSGSPIAAHQHKHGDGVKVIALSVPDVDHAYREATSRGADERRRAARGLRRARRGQASPTIETYGETLHTFVERAELRRPVPPRLRAASRTAPRTAGCCWPSTTSSATSSSARWRRGSSTTRTSSG